MRQSRAVFHSERSENLIRYKLTTREIDTDQTVKHACSSASLKVRIRVILLGPLPLSACGTTPLNLLILRSRSQIIRHRGTTPRNRRQFFPPASNLKASKQGISPSHCSPPPLARKRENKEDEMGKRGREGKESRAWVGDRSSERALPPRERSRT